MAGHPVSEPDAPGPQNFIRFPRERAWRTLAAMIHSIDEKTLSTKKHLHFIGIGGSGMFPLVQILHSRGFYITGSDNNETDTLNYERSVLGIPIHLGHSAENIKGADCVVYTAAILPDNVELVAAKNSGALVVERSEMLGLISREYPDAVCVCGTHGKTTCTSMITQILLGAGLDPSAVIGGKLKAIGGSGRVGKSSLFVCEACEFVDTFLHLDPDVAVILNIDDDHMDYFKTIDNSIRSFHRFAEMASRAVIYNGDDANTCRAVEGIEGKEMITFGLSSQNDYYPADLSYPSGTCTRFTLMHRGEAVCPVTLNIPGRHNVCNALAAAAASLYAGAKPRDITEHLAQFRGAGRRFEILGEVNGVTIADDYAHHPRELEVTLKAASEMGFRKVWAVFQPFTYSRTSLLFDDFVRVLQIPDHTVLSEIMGSREVNTYGIYSKDLAEKIPGCVWFPGFPEIAGYVMAHAQPGDLVITLGCGDIYKCARMMLQG